MLRKFFFQVAVTSRQVRRLILFSSFLGTSIMYAAKGPDILTIERSVELALAQNPEVAAPKRSLEAAQFELRSIRSKRLAKLTGDVYGAKVIDGGDQVVSSNLILKQPIVDGGKISASIEAARLNIKAQEATLSKTERTIEERVKKGYYTLTTLQDLLLIKQGALHQLQQHAERIHILFKKGMVPKVEVLKVELAIAQAQQDLFEHKSDIEYNRAAFNQVLGRGLTDPFELAPLADYVPISFNLEEWLKIGMDNRPELAEIENVIRESELQIKIAKSDLFPQVSVIGRYERQKDIYIDTERWLSAISATMDIWSWGETRTKIRQAREKVAESNFNRQAIKNQIELELRKAYFSLVSGQQKLELAKKVIGFAEEYYRIQDLRFKNGRATNTELLEAQFNLTKAKAFYSVLLNAFRVSQATAELMLGVRSLDLRETPESKMTDDEFLALVERKAFDFFLQNQDGTTGLFADTVHGDASIAVTGFGLTALCVGVDRQWITEAEGKRRALLALKTFRGGPQAPAEGKYGFFYHFLEMKTGRRAGRSEVSSVDTALLVAGALTAGEYFGGEVKESSEIIYAQVDWPKFLNRKTNLFYMGWTPEEGFQKWQWNMYTDETILVNLLAIGAPRNPVNTSVFYAWERVKLGNGNRLIIPSWQGALFTYQYAHAWFDFRNLIDGSGADWWHNSVEATMANIEFCEAKSDIFKSFGKESWGITAYDTPAGYVMDHGFPPALSGKPVFDGTLSPSGPAGSIVFTPRQSIAALRRMYRSYPRLWGVYGFKDSFNLDNNWFSTSYYGLGQGITLLMIENFRSELIWRTFMKNQNIRVAIRRAKFNVASGRRR